MAKMPSGRTMPSGPQAMLASPWTGADVFMKNSIAFYRARVASVIHRLKNHGWCETAFRGSYNMFVALHDIAVITTSLEIKLEFELDNKAMVEVLLCCQHSISCSLSLAGQDLNQ